jgi:hypothetical protein
VLAQLEHYQNEFILHDGLIDKLEEAIELQEANMAGQDLQDKDALDITLVKNYKEFRNKMETPRQFYVDLKKGFFRYLSKYM